MLYFVTYDLTKSDHEYGELYEELKRSGNWWHYLDSTWLVATPESIDELYQRIRAKIDDNDNLLIFDITNKTYQGWLPKKAWEWIRNHIGGD